MPPRLALTLSRLSRDLLVVVAGLAVVLRVLLVIDGPAYGYVWDFYQQGVAVLATQHRLPIASDCWACYHPPLYYVLGWPFYAIGRWIAPANDAVATRMLAGLSLASVGVVIYYTVRLLRLAGIRGSALAFTVIVTLSVPILFISSDAPEADIVATAILSACLFHLVRVFGGSGAVARRDAIGLGILAGLAAATKTNGLVALACAGVLLVPRVVARGARRRAVLTGVVIVAVAAAIGGWKYVDNARRHGTPFFANGSAAQGFALTDRGDAASTYELATVRPAALRSAYERSVRGQLTDLPVYRSVPTTLYAQVWGDMGIFSVSGRHGAPGDPYRSKRIPPWLPMTVVALGLVPGMLAIAGFGLSLRRPALRPIAAFVMLTIAAYVWWLLPQARWALKAKYILSLLPASAVYAAIAQQWLAAHARRVATISTILLAALVVVAEIYQFLFAAT